ncbi:MAG TPA: hypothetical protein VD962_08510 [Rubricoccaceae bacterium]|nr:hypothetical protein [Rubricoccaceae bacterium]
MRLLPLFALAFALVVPARAQRVDPRFGVGLDFTLAPPGQDIVPEGLGVGFRARVAVPVNADLSFAGDVGAIGFVLRGQDDAAYALNPQLSAILTLPRARWARYLLGGFGGIVPLSDEDVNGAPTIHAGIGWALPLRDTSLYFEVDPSLVIGETETTVLLPFRTGVIF